MGAGRFRRNPEVNASILLEALRQAVIEGVAEHRLVLVHPQHRAMSVARCAAGIRSNTSILNQSDTG